MPTNLDRARLIAKDVELVSVSLAEAKLTSSIDPLKPPDLIELSNKYRARFEVRPEETHHLRVVIDFDLAAAGNDRAESRRPILALKATFLLVYRLPPNAAYPEDSYEHFAWLNGPYNAWPYWRELVQTVSGRVGLAGVVVPVFRPQVINLPSTEVPVSKKEGKSAPRPKALKVRSARPN